MVCLERYGDEEDSGNESDSGDTVFANKSRWDRHFDDSNESTAPETVSSHQDSGEGPSRRAQATGGSPDDDGDDSDNGSNHSGGTIRDNGEGPSRLPQAAGGAPDDGGGDPDDSSSDDSIDSGYASEGRGRNSGDDDEDEDADEDGNDRDESVMPDVIEDDSDDSDSACHSDDGDDVALWPHERLIVEYRRKVDKIGGIRRKEKNNAIRGLEGRINGFELEIQRLQDRLRGIRPPPTPWTTLWQQGQPYLSVTYREACKQLNMSQVPTNVHPQLTLSLRELSQRQMNAAYGLNGGGGGDGNGNGNGNGNRNGADNMSIDSEGDDGDGGSDDESNLESDLESDLFVRQESSAPPADQDEMACRPFNFNGLPREVQERIFRYLFVKTDLVHCLSRLDPRNPPLTPRPLHRFFWGGSQRQCSVTLAHRPNSVLRLLLVCKRWLYLGVHAFYGLNTFAFSSLGELGRFMKGSGSRLERIVNVELFWHGAIMPRHPSLVNQRTLPLQFFCDTRRLKTLVVHLQERYPEDERRTRRKYEIQKEDDNGNDNSGVPYAGSRLDLKNPFKVMMEQTRIQPNHRQYRSIRTMHGLDFVYQLRGMTWARIREAQGPVARQKIRDWSVVDDINAVVTLPKEPGYAFASELDNLSPIAGLGNFVPTDDDKDVVRAWYADDDPMREILGMDDDGDTISVVSSDARLSDYSDDGGSDDDDDPDTLSVDGGGDNDSGVDVDMNDDLDDSDIDVDMADDSDDRDNTPSDANSTLGDDGNDREDPEEDDAALDGINDGLDQMDMGDESESIDEDAGDDNMDTISTTTDSSGDSDDSSRPNDTGLTGITSDYSSAVNAVNLGQSSRNRSNTVSSSAADAGDDAGDLGTIEDDKNEEEENDDDHKDRAGSEQSSLFVPQNNNDDMSVKSEQASTYIKTDSDEEKHKIIDLTSDDNGGPSRAARGDKIDASVVIKNENTGSGSGSDPGPSRRGSLVGANRDVPMEIDFDEHDNKPSHDTDSTMDNSDAESGRSSWQDAQSRSPSAVGSSPSIAGFSSSFGRRRFSPGPGSGMQRGPKRQRTQTPSESGAGSCADSPISIDD
ncbi:uncharacterized protein PG986_012008 [Apiospora aurea]|uniref:F-box domain-containing protein n=1 Tax=Apiospora aurea TaxID=335848 RepID=A0ABR1PYR4_9PEZI